jgi:hypothetical protein
MCGAEIVALCPIGNGRSMYASLEYSSGVYFPRSVSRIARSTRKSRMIEFLFSALTKSALSTPCERHAMVAMAGTAAIAARSGRRGVVVDRQCDAAVTIGVCDVVEARMQKVAIQFSFRVR